MITHGGGSPNVIPPYAASRFLIRSFDLGYAQELKRRVIACAEGAAIATGAKVEWHEYQKPHLSYLPNNMLGEVVRANMEALGRTVGDAEEVYGSTDFGNVSRVIPTTYALFGICGEELIPTCVPSDIMWGNNEGREEDLFWEQESREPQLIFQWKKSNNA